MAERLNLRQLIQEARQTLQDAQVSPRGMTALYCAILLALDLVIMLPGLAEPFSLFLTVLCRLMALGLEAGLILYCMAVRQGQRAEYLTLFDGFSFVGKLIAQHLVALLLVMLWGSLFILPGIVVFYRYRFAVLNLCEDPSISFLQALYLSKQQTRGYKLQLLVLDLRFIGWTLLSGLPSMAISYLSLSPEVVLTYWQALVLVAFSGLWTLVVSLFYLPTYLCTELAYFDKAKATSGIFPGSLPGQNGDAPPPFL